MNEIKNILEYAMQMEKNANVFYTHYTDLVSSNDTKDLFSELAIIEQKHYNVLKKTYDLLNYEQPPLDISWVVDSSTREKNNAIIADNSNLLSESGLTDDVNILRMAYLIENDFATFYKNAASQSDDTRIKEFLSELASWEEEHAKLFKTRYDMILKNSWKNIDSYIR